MPPVPHVSSQNIGQPGSTSASSSGNNLSANAGGSGSGGGGCGEGDKGPDYVYFERKPSQFGESTLGKAMAAKMKLELFYKEGVEGVVGRKER
jgi:protein-serine/threonine kinase